MRTGRDLRHKMQMICSHCTNRPRKDEATVWVYATREDAEAECERRNTRSEPLTPNRTVIIGGEEYDENDTDWTGVIV